MKLLEKITPEEAREMKIKFGFHIVTNGEMIDEVIDDGLDRFYRRYGDWHKSRAYLKLKENGNK